MPKPVLGDLDLSHLLDAPVVLAEAAEAPDTKPSLDPRAEETWVFHFKHTTPRGAVFEGQFTNNILTCYQQSRISAIIARLQDGLPYESIEPSTRILNQAIAHMTLSLSERPDWAQNLGLLKDVGVIVALWEKVQGHETYFFRGDSEDTQQGPAE